MSKQIEFNETARRAMEAGVDKLADAVRITLGPRVNIQDGCILHTDLDVPVEIGNDVTVGHGAIVHGAHVGDETLIAMRATLIDNT